MMGILKCYSKRVLIICFFVALIFAITFTASYAPKKDNKEGNTINTEETTLNETTESIESSKETTTKAPEPVVNNELWCLTLVNPWNTLPEDYVVELKDIGNSQYIDTRIYNAYIEMIEAANKEGLYPVVCSAYRTKEKQASLHTNKINEYLNYGYSYENAVIEASKWVAPPGTSEHQLGLALDLISQTYQVLNQEQEQTPEQQWLMANSYKYGFILRYPSSKSEVTGINYEPWHYRYVGKEAAKIIYEEKICFEEYISKYNF